MLVNWSTRSPSSPTFPSSNAAEVHNISVKLSLKRTKIYIKEAGGWHIKILIEKFNHLESKFARHVFFVTRYPPHGSGAGGHLAEGVGPGPGTFAPNWVTNDEIFFLFFFIVPLTSFQSTAFIRFISFCLRHKWVLGK